MRAYSLVGSYVFMAFLAIGAVVFNGCSAVASEVSPEGRKPSNAVQHSAESGVRGSTIEITENGPADTVRAFYTKLREKRIREAIYLTNLRPAIEGLSDDELKEFSVDFEAVAKRVPEQLQITGEIISGDVATVTANLPNDDDKLEVQQIRLKKNGDFWIIQTVDEVAESQIKKDGKNYFRALKIESHQEDAKQMLERIAKAQVVYSMQNGEKYGEITKLVELGILPEDVKTSESTGYNYAVVLTEGGRNYYGTATPAVYKKTGINSYILVPKDKGLPVVSGLDNGGKPLTK